MKPQSTIRTTEPELAIRLRAVDALHPNPKNPRTHSPKRIQQIAASISAFGLATPILIGTGDVVIAGHGRLAAARSLGIVEVPTVSLAHLSQAQQRAYAIADNRLAELSG